MPSSPVSFSRLRDGSRIADAALLAQIPLSTSTLERLGLFAELVATGNEKTNLTGARTPDALVDVLFGDAFALATNNVIPVGARVVDVGAGAGAPTIPLAIMRTDLACTLVEPRRLRVAFLRAAIEELALGDRVRVDEHRFAASKVAGAPFDVALSRATFPPNEWRERGRILAPRVLVLAAPNALPEGSLERRDYCLPFAGTARALGVYG